MGYSNQTEIITDTSKIDQTSIPGEHSTSIFDQWEGCNEGAELCGKYESLGAGDIGYIIDYQLVNGVYKTMAGKTSNGTASTYWLASRRFGKNGNDWYFTIRDVGVGGSLDALIVYNNTGSSRICRVRPILTLKENINIKSGDGKRIETAYTFE